MAGRQTRTERQIRPDLLAALNDAMRRLSSHVTFYSDAVATALDMNPTDLDCLGVVESDGPLTAGRLAELTGLTTGAITGVLDRLERGGHIRREPDPADRRKVVVHVVPESQQAIGAVFEPMLAASRELYRRYGDDELAVVVDFATRTVPLLREETLRLRDVASDEQASAVPASASSAGIDRATLRFTRGVARLEVDAVRDLGELYRASWHGAAPAVRWHDGVLNVQYRRSPFAHFRTGGALTIDAGPRWTVEVNGGVAHAVFDLRDTRVESLTINGGASSVDIHLPAPDGRLELRVNGGTNAVTITRPAGVPARARVKGGAANLVLDAQRLGAVGGGTDLRSDGYERATDSVDVQVRGGARSLSIIHR